MHCLTEQQMSHVYERNRKHNPWTRSEGTKNENFIFFQSIKDFKIAKYLLCVFIYSHINNLCTDTIQKLYVYLSQISIIKRGLKIIRSKCLQQLCRLYIKYTLSVKSRLRILLKKKKIIIKMLCKVRNEFVIVNKYHKYL